LSEPLMLLLSLLGVFLVYRQQWVWAGVAFALAILSKEVAAVFVFGVAAWLLLNRRFRLALQIALISCLPAVIWGSLVTLWLGESPLNIYYARMETLPFWGLQHIHVSPAAAYIWIWVAFPALALGILDIWDIAKWKSSPDTLILLANVALVAFMPRFTWWNVGGALRVVMGLVLASYLYASFARPKLLPWISAFWLTSGLIVLPALLL
jgi:hypothetical protein